MKYLLGHTVAISLQCAVTLQMRQFTGPLALDTICIQRYIYVTDRSEDGWYATELHVITIECEAPIKINASLDRNLHGICIPGKTLRNVNTDKSKILFSIESVIKIYITFLS
jgi:hypothetical protein